MTGDEAGQIVFSNTTPLIALAGIGQLALLPALFGRVHLVEAVIEECAAGGRVVVPDLSGPKALGLIPSFTAAAQQMQRNGIYFHERLLAQLQARAGER